jgi:cyclophilin family peptidyl-prolyl cis-trans isomerase
VDPENALVMELKCGEVRHRAQARRGPNHVERIKELTREGFYDGIIFHRVIDGFMAQTGDPTGTGMGGSERPDVPAEFSDVPFTRGTVGMARSSDPDSANSQFFIMFDEGSFLNGQYTVWGEVVEGMDCVDQINKGEPPADPDEIIRMQVMADAG